MEARLRFLLVTIIRSFPIGKRRPRANFLVSNRALHFQSASHVLRVSAAGQEIPTESIHSLAPGRRRREQKASLLIVRLSTARLRNISPRARDRNICITPGDVIEVLRERKEEKNPLVVTGY